MSDSALCMDDSIKYIVESKEYTTNSMNYMFDSTEYIVESMNY